MMERLGKYPNGTPSSLYEPTQSAGYGEETARATSENQGGKAGGIGEGKRVIETILEELHFVHKDEQTFFQTSPAAVDFLSDTLVPSSTPVEDHFFFGHDQTPPKYMRVIHDGHKIVGHAYLLQKT